MVAQHTNGQIGNGRDVVQRPLPPVGRNNGHGQAARRVGNASPTRSVRGAPAMTKTRKPTARRARANVVEQTGDAVLALIAEHDRLWQLKTEKATAAANALHDQL